MSRKSSEGRFVIGAFFSSLLNVCNTRRRSEIIYNKPELGKRESLAPHHLVQRLLLCVRNLATYTNRIRISNTSNPILDVERSV